MNRAVHGHDPASVAMTAGAGANWADLLRAAFDDAPVGMALLTLDGRIRRANQALGTLLDCPPAALVGRSFAALAGPIEGSAALAAASLLADGDLPACTVEQCLPCADGRAIWTLVTLGVIRDTAGRPAGLVAHVQDMTERKIREEQLRHHALHDPMTGLPNRVLFAERLELALAATRPGERVAVLLVDLDGFKAVNDNLGHAAGDGLLEVVAGRLAGCLRAGDTAARVGGDEFALLVEHTRDAVDADLVARRVLQILRAPVPLVGGGEVRVSAAIGIALGAPELTPDDLLRQADAALYRAKELGTGQTARFGADPTAPPLTSRPPRARRLSLERARLVAGVR